MSKIKWILKQLIPLTYWTKYKEGDEQYFEIWSMWFGKCYNSVRFEI